MEEETKKKLLRPSCDVVFQALFQENKENITQSLISDILGKPVEIIDIKAESTIARKYPTDKSGRLDLKTKFKDGTICQIEMQMSGGSNIIKRILYYWAKTYSKQLKSGGKYQELKKTIGILISDFEIKELEGIEELDTKWQIIETKKGKKVLTEDLEFYIIEIPKAKRVLAKEANNRIAQWLVFLDNPNTERVEEIMKENEDVKKAKEVLSQMSEDEELQMLAELREKWDLDERSALASAKDEGKIEIATNMLKEGTSIEFIQKVTGLAIEELEKIPEYAEREDLQRLAELHEKWDIDERSALASAKDEGIEEGIKEGKIEIATNMLKEGITVDIIQKVTGLTKEEIEKLQK